jgi:hypothetical protein
LYFSYYPFENTLYQGIDAARQAHAAWTLARAGMRDAAAAALGYARTQPCDGALELSRDAFILLALCEMKAPPIQVADIAEKIFASIDRHGRLATWQPPPQVDADEDDPEESEDEFDAEDLQNYVPGQALLALGAATETGAWNGDERSIERAFRYYRHRFRHKRDFGQVSWLTLAASAWSRLTHNREWAELTFEITDWILEFQHARTGGFLTDHQPDAPGYTTAVYLEAVAAAIATAAIFNRARMNRYTDAWQRGFAFLDRLLIQERDASVLPNPEYAVGGVRENLYSGHVRIDFVQHSLAAVIERYPGILQQQTPQEENQNG